MNLHTIYFIRHAKSSWDSPLLSDFERPLNERGLRDAPKMATHLKKIGVIPDAIISSPANRAQSTALLFQEKLEVSEDNFYLKEEIYEAFSATIFSVVQNIPDRYKTVLLFGHNPAMTSVANQFTSDFIPNIPTCGIAKIECKIQNWNQFNEANGVLTAFYYPKMFA